MSDSRKPTRETLDAYIDGQLPPEEMTHISKLLTDYRDLRAYVEEQQALRNHLDAAFSPIISQAIPEALQQTLHTARVSRIWRSWRALNQWRNWLAQGSSWRLAIPAAAAMALGLVIGVGVEQSPDSQSYLVRNRLTGEVIAQGALARALDEQLASDDEHASAARVGVSFQNKSGQDCRTFSLQGSATSSNGVACRTKESWVVAAIVSSVEKPGMTTPYEMAGSEMPAAIRALVNQMIVGAPFDAATERAARARRWQGGP